PGVARLVANGDAAVVAEWWARRLDAWADAGVAGFRCLRPLESPPALWRALIGAVRERHPEAMFLASLWLAEGDAATELAGCGFDLAACSIRDWDFRAEGFTENLDRLMQLAPAVMMAEAPFGRRLCRDFTDASRARRAARRALAFAAA